MQLASDIFNALPEEDKEQTKSYIVRKRQELFGNEADGRHAKITGAIE